MYFCNHPKSVCFIPSDITYSQWLPMTPEVSLSWKCEILCSLEKFLTDGKPFKVKANYKDRKCAVNENSSLRIIPSVHYNAGDTIL